MRKEELKKLEDDLWHSADTLRANSDLGATEYSVPVLGLIFLKFADNKYKKFEAQILAEFEELKGTRREKSIQEIAVEKCGFYLPDASRYDKLLALPDDQDIAEAIKNAMQAIEDQQPALEGVLPKQEYFRFTRSEENRGIPKKLLRTFADIPANADADMLGKIYEYFLAEFALSEGQGGGEFFTPSSVVRLMVEMIGSGPWDTYVIDYLSFFWNSSSSSCFRDDCDAFFRNLNILNITKVSALPDMSLDYRK